MHQDQDLPDLTSEISVISIGEAVDELAASTLDHPYASSGFHCAECQVSCSSKLVFVNHRKDFHGETLEEDEETDPKTTSAYSDVNLAAFQCEHCGNYLKSKKTLKRHMDVMHNIAQPSSKQSRFRCMLCEVTVAKAEDLRKHYLEIHGIEIETDNFSFETYEEFCQWKKEVEVESTSLFVKYSGDKPISDGKFVRQIFSCQRSGNYTSRSIGQRRLKRSGSIKINGHCPARILAIKWKDGRVDVTFTKTHIGHDFLPNTPSLEEHRVVEQAKAKLEREISDLIQQCETIEQLQELSKLLDPAKNAITVMRRKKRRAELRNRYGSIPRTRKQPS